MINLFYTLILIIYIYFRNYPADELNVKYQKLVSTNLLGYSQYLEKLPKKQLQEAKEENKQLILTSNKFWKYAKDEAKSVCIIEKLLLCSFLFMY